MPPAKAEEEDLNMGNRQRVKWAIYLSAVTVLVFLCVSKFGPNMCLQRPSFSMPEPITKYAIVFDGGSTGTRIHIFSFINSSNGLLTLQNEYFEEVKPGLSNFANMPQNAAKSVLNLLEKAKVFVPSDLWDETPLALKATAGLRLLPKPMSDSILEEVYKVFQSSPFLTDEKSVEVLDGEDEGLFAWYTLNFLLGKLNKTSHSAVSLDLGGGSTQVTFTPAELNTLRESPKEYIKRTNVHSIDMSIYTHSYLGLGLMSARLSILKLSSENLSLSKNDNKVLPSACIHPNNKLDWNQGGKTYFVTGREDSEYGFDQCYASAVKFLGKSVDKPDELQYRDIYALSYYYDRAADLGLIGKEGGLITVGNFIEGCANSCSDNSAKDTFLCLDCSYISALLHHGLGLNEDKQIKLVKQIDGVETSWGLGAAFNMLL